MKQYIIVVFLSFLASVLSQEKNIYGTYNCGWGEYPGPDARIVCQTKSVDPCIFYVPGEMRILLNFKTKPDKDLIYMECEVRGFYRPYSPENNKTSMWYPRRNVTNIKSLETQALYNESLPKNSRYSAEYTFNPEKYGYVVGQNGTIHVEFKLHYEEIWARYERICFKQDFEVLGLPNAPESPVDSKDPKGPEDTEGPKVTDPKQDTNDGIENPEETNPDQGDTEKNSDNIVGK